MGYHWFRLLLFPFFLLILTGCDFQSRQSYMDPKGEIAQIQYDLFMLTVWVTGGIFIVVGGALLWAVVRYRERPSDRDQPPPAQSHGDPLIEVGLILAAVVLLVIIAIPTVRDIWHTHPTPDEPESYLGSWFQGEAAAGTEEEPLIIYAYGWQWWFSFEYPQLGITTGNEFAMPEGKVVHFELRARDVIHSFWLPKLAGKVDMIPGRANHMWMRASEPGHYYGQCAEYCGEAHAYMQFRADVLTVDDFHEWVRQRQSEPPPPVGDDWDEFVQKAARDPDSLPDNEVVHGARLFFGRGACVQCHAIDGTMAAGLKGPNLTHVASNKSLAAGWMEHLNEDGSIDREKQYENLFEWIRRSEEIKPGNLMYHDVGGMKDVDLTDEEVHQISAFLQTLK